MRRIAITGGIAEGKSTVLGWISEAGVETLSADEVADELWKSPQFLSRIGEALEIANPTRGDVRERISASPLARRSLNAIMHPEIARRMLASDALVLEIPLLIESCLQARFNRVWVVTCGPEEQLARLTARIGDEGAARRLLGTQLPTSVKIPFADRVFRTNREPRLVRQDVIEALREEGLVSA